MGGGNLHGSPSRAALVNSGGGGAAGDGNARSQVPGASGVVILRMATTVYSAGSTSGSPTAVTDDSDTVLIFKSSGSFTLG